MASQSKLQSATTPSSLSSRLSPHAQPFIFSHRQQALVGVSASSINDTFSGLDTNCYSSEVGLALTEQHDGAVTFSASIDDDHSFLRKENLAVEGSQLFGEAIGSWSRHLTNVHAAQVPCHNHPNLLKLNLKGAEEGHPVDDSSVVAIKDKIDNEDVDEDSPCWKGKFNSPFIVSETLDPELAKSKPESSSVLNPKAPQFLPRAIERRSSAPVGDPGAYVSMSFQERLPPISSPLFSNQVSQESTDVLNSDSSTGYFAMLYESEENTHAGCNMGGIDDSLIGPNIAMHGDGGCSPLVETLLELSKSLSTPLGVDADADILVDTIHALSELLLGNCSGSFFFKELQLEKIKRTISNLSLLSVKDMDGQTSSIHGSNVEFSQSYQTKSSASSKLPGTELQPPKSKVVISRPPPPLPEVRKYELQPARTKVVISPPPPEVSNLKKYELQKMGSSVIMQDFKSFSSDIGNEIAQATMKSSTSSGYEMEHQISPQALIYKDLWLQATQELHFIKKKAWRNTEKNA